MKRQKIIRIWITIILFINLLAGCSWYPDGTTYNVDDESQVQVETNDSGDIKGKLTENVNIDAEVDIPDNKNWKNYSVKLRMPDIGIREKAVSLFEGENTVKPSEITNNDGAINAYQYQFPNGNNILISNGRIIYSKPMMIDRSYDRYIKGDNGIKDNINELFPYKELDGISREESVKKIEEICEKLNIEIGSEPEVYAIDYEHAQAIVDSDSTYNLDKAGNPKNKWVKDNNAYAIFFRINMNGIPITDLDYHVNGGNASGSYVEAIINKDGIISFAVNGIYDVTEESIVGNQLCTVSDVLKILESRFHYMTSNSQTDIEKICLEYVPVYTSELKKYDLKPYWICKINTLRTDIKDGNGTSTKLKKTLFIDAVTKTVLE